MWPIDAEEAGDLAAMMRRVIHYVQHELPDGLPPGVAFQVLVIEDGRPRFLRSRRRPTRASGRAAPAIRSVRPRECGRLSVHEAGKGCACQARKPHAIGGVDVRQRADDASIGGLEIARELLGREAGGWRRPGGGWPMRCTRDDRAAPPV